MTARTDSPVRLDRVVLAAALVVLSTLPAATTQADSGDRTLRFGLTFVNPTGEGTVPQSRSETFGTSVDDLVTVDLDTLLRIQTDSGMGFNFGFEFLLTRTLGLDVNLGFASHDVEIEVGGQVTLTPWKSDGNEPPVPIPDPDNAESAELTGAVAGQLPAIPLTLGLNIYVLRTRSLDLYVGPMVGIVLFGDLELDRGSLSADPPIFPVEDELEPATVEVKESPAAGLSAGLDIWLGDQGWLLSIAGRFLWVDARVQAGRQNSVPLDPWTIQVGAGYRF